MKIQRLGLCLITLPILPPPPPPATIFGLSLKFDCAQIFLINLNFENFN